MSTTRDPGRQPERTRLAWRRTVLTLTVVALLAGRLAVERSGPVVGVVAVIVAALGWLLVLVRSARRITAMADPRPAPARWAVRVIALVTAGYAALGVALVTL